MKKKICIILIALVSLAVFGKQSQAMIINGGFENPVVVGSSVFGSIPGWTASGPGVEIQNGGIAGDPNGGVQLAELDSSGNSGISQAIATASGAWYNLSFFYSGAPYSNISTNGIMINWDGGFLDEIKEHNGTNNTKWTAHSYLVMATSTTTSLEFLATGTSDGKGGYLDDVSLELEAVPTPEPTTLLLMGIGIVGLIGGAARKKLTKNAVVKS